MKKAIRMTWIIMTTYLIVGMIVPVIFVDIAHAIYGGSTHIELNTAGYIFMAGYLVVTTAYMRKDVKNLFNWVRNKFRKRTA